jgi:phosphotransferase system HPr (HPr) family protein
MMRVRLSSALHARPANLLVRLASSFEATVEIRLGNRSANAARILEVLALSAREGDEIELAASGAAGGEALAAVTALIAQGFSADLVPEAGAAAAPGIAIGVAVPWTTEDAAVTDDAPLDSNALRDAFARVLADLRALVATLPESEAALFEPEVAIVEELRRKILARVAAGEAPRAALDAVASVHAELVYDARTRIESELARTHDALAARITAKGDDVVIVTDALTPSLVASLGSRAVGVVAQSRGRAPVTSHAAILARGRGLPLVFVEEHVAEAIADGDLVVVDTIEDPARVWVAPSDALVADARARKSAHASRAPDAQRAPTGIELRVNVSSLSEAIPAAAAAIGLVRTELLFAGRRTAPTAAEHDAALATLAARAHGRPIVVRLFDAGGDKPTPWLPPPHRDARGVELLFAHRDVLAVQLAAIARMRADARVLIPFTRSAADVDEVRSLLPRPLAVGAMIETLAAVSTVDAIAAASDFVCVGTNDLGAEITGEPRERASALVDPRVVSAVGDIVRGAHAHGKKVTVCGEIARDPRGALALVDLGVDSLSVATTDFGSVCLALSAGTCEKEP